MELPKWKNLKINYPAYEASTVFKSIGGKVEFNFDIRVFNNACAIRVSRALNKSDGPHVVPYIKDISPNGKLEPQVSSGENKKWYIFRVKMLSKYLSKKYGEPEKLKPTKYKNKLKGRKGIIIFEVPGWGDATGHADLWNGSRCLWQGYGGQSTSVLFWEAS